MCGIFSILNSNDRNISDIIYDAFELGQNRGPESSELKKGFMNTILGFHRLAINGLNDKSNQPLYIDGCYLICNGEIYNYKQLYKTMGVEPETDSDCEVIIHMYKKYGIEQCLQMLDGVFAFVLLEYDINVKEQENAFNAYIARDPYGIRSLYEGVVTGCTNSSDVFSGLNDKYLYASEMKCLVPLKQGQENMVIKQFQPGSYSKFVFSHKINEKWKKTITNKKYTSYPHINYSLECSENREIEDIIYNSLTNAVLKRIDNTERPIACLLSGGLDSSLITSIVSKNWKGDYPLETYSIGMEGSEDLQYAQMVADHLGTKHTTIVVSETEFFESIPKVIYAIESYDTTTVRASVGNYLISKYISENSDAKVIFNGDGSDEITGGYMYFHDCPDEIEFDKECKRLLSDIYTFDVLRSDKCIASNGLEARTPFLDKGFVQTYLSIPTKFRFHPKNDNIEKYLLRKSFDRNDHLPDEILWRSKEAFSDGVSKRTRSWYEIIQERLENPDMISEDFKNKVNTITVNPPKTNEQKYYRYIFEKFFTSNYCTVLPYFWMPKYTDTEECSARALTSYKKQSKNVNNLKNTILNNTQINTAVDRKKEVENEIRELENKKGEMIKNIHDKIKIYENEHNELQNFIVNNCNHKWILGSDGGIDETPEKICENCNAII